MAVDDRDPILQKQLGRVETARDVLSGTRAVKAAGSKYLPYAYKGQEKDPVSYNGYKKRVPFYAAASRAQDGFLGMMFRREPVLEADGTLALIKNVITNRGDSVERLAQQAAREALASGFALLVTDHPEGKASSKGAAIAEGIRPFTNLYKFENILEYTVGIVRNMQKPVRVRVMDNASTVRLFKLVDGFVVIEIYEADSDGVFPDEGYPTRVVEPRANGKRLSEVPCDPVTASGELDFTKGPLDNVIETNLEHYATQGLLTTLHMYGISPMLFFAGVERSTSIDWVPGAVWCEPEADAKPYVLSVPADHAIPLEHQLQALEDRLATLASRILARHKAVAEAAETEAVRQGAENSVLAMIANSVSQTIEKALQRVADYSGGGEVRFQINTDFVPGNITPAEVDSLLGLNERSKLSDKSLFYKLRDGGIYDETLTYEQEQERIAQSAVVEAPLAPQAKTPDE
ncbi:DUF4055 domain-containing protein [Erythrobacter sp. A30-3]|nr:DUF4055 domain-containing protein [Erythrobacter sp. A30-3]